MVGYERKVAHIGIGDAVGICEVGFVDDVGVVFVGLA